MAKQGQILTTTVTIAGGDATGLSTVASLGGGSIVGILVPSAWTAAGLDFAVCATSTGTFAQVVNTAGSLVVVGAAGMIVSDYVLLAPTVLPTLPFLKLRSATGGTAVTQGATSPADDRVLTIFYRIP